MKTLKRKVTIGIVLCVLICFSLLIPAFYNAQKAAYQANVKGELFFNYSIAEQFEELDRFVFESENSWREEIYECYFLSNSEEIKNGFPKQTPLMYLVDPPSLMELMVPHNPPPGQTSFHAVRLNNNTDTDKLSDYAIVYIPDVYDSWRSDKILSVAELLEQMKQSCEKECIYAILYNRKTFNYEELLVFLETEQ